MRDMQQIILQWIRDSKEDSNGTNFIRYISYFVNQIWYSYFLDYNKVVLKVFSPNRTLIKWYGRRVYMTIDQSFM
jgi:hypothetical protein